MSDFPPTPDPLSDAASDTRLASLLDQAYQADPAPLSLARLERHWTQLRRHERRRLLWRRSLSIAAAVAGVALIASLTLSSGDHPAVEVVGREAPEPAPQPSLPLVAIQQLSNSPESGLTPTPLQQALFTVRSRGTASSRQALSALLVAHAEADAARVEASLLREHSPEELKTRLEREWKRLPSQQQSLAAALLARLGGRESLATLRRMAQHEPLRRTMVKALLAAGDSPNLATALDIAPTAEVAHALLTHPALPTDPWPFDTWLGLVHEPRTRKGALIPLTAIDSPPIDPLMAALDAEEKNRRVAAALALGELGGTEVTQRLIELVTSDDRRHAEAWLAVVQCRGPLANEFLALAARDPLLLGHYNAALIRQQQFVP